MEPNPLAGFLVAVGSAVPFAAYILPRKLCTLNVFEYQYWLGFAVLPVCLATAIIAGAPLWGRLDLIGWSLLCGPIWVLGSLSYSSAVDRIGVARSTPVKNFAPAFASLYGVLLFTEYTIGDPLSLGMAVGGLLLLLAAAWVLGKASAPEHERAIAFSQAETPERRRIAFVHGWLFSFGAAFFYGLYAVPLKLAVARGGLDPYTSCVYLAVGVLLTGLAVYMVRMRRLVPTMPSRRDFALTQIAGAIWAPAQILGTVAMVLVAMSISWPASNLSTVFAVLWGVWVFKEVKLDAHKREVVLSLLLYVVGLILLMLAAPKGRV